MARGVRYDQLRRDRRRRCAHIRGVIGERHVRLVTDAADDGTRKAHDRAHQGLVVERREIFTWAAAARDDYDVQFAQLRQSIQRSDQRLHGTDALHLRGGEDQLDARIATRDDGLHVAPRGADRARDDANATGRRRKRALAFQREEAFGGEPPLERLKTEERVTSTRGTDVVDPELAAAVTVVELDPAVREDLRPVARRERNLRSLRREQNALHLTHVVLEREVHVPGGRYARLEHLAFDPEILELVAGLECVRARRSRLSTSRRP